MKSKCIYLSAILTVILCFSGIVLAYSGDGDGTAGNPYQISTVEDWQELMASPNDWSSSFILMADVNLAGVTLIPVGRSIEGYLTPFNGVFDGNDNIISNAVVYATHCNDSIGLFDYVDTDGQISNLGVEDVNITGNYGVGGLVAINHGSLTGCYVTGSVSGAYDVGGMVGWNYSGTLTDCYTTTSVTGFDHAYYVGGLVGFNDSGTLTSCYATGTVSGDSYSKYIGGLAGENRNIGGTVIGCYATGSVSGDYVVGGLVGCNWLSAITTSYATGSVTGNDDVGGLVGFDYEDEGSISGCYWDIETSGQTTSAGGTGKTTAEMKQINTFANWDFVETWGIEDNQTYPFLKLTYPVGDLNHNKAVDLFDFAIFASHWLEDDR